MWNESADTDACVCVFVCTGQMYYFGRSLGGCWSRPVVYVVASNTEEASPTDDDDGDDDDDVDDVVAGEDSSGSGSLWGYSVALYDGADKFVAMGAPHEGPSKRGIAVELLMLC